MNFFLGSTEDDLYAEEDEFPANYIYLDAYWMDKTEVTNLMYQMCVRDGDCNPPAKLHSYTRDWYYGNPEFQNFPVTYMSWTDADIYCNWAERRLPTEAEWEKAARGPNGRIYPWRNNSPSQNLLNYNSFYGDFTEVGYFPDGASFYVILDMAGNVWEWVQDYYQTDYYERISLINPTGPPETSVRVLRGGSVINSEGKVRATNRDANDPALHGGAFGIRCAMDSEE